MLISKNEKGRTMVEMIGYLGIIAMLAVGIYSGYNIASQKFKTEKTINTVHDLIQNIRTSVNTKRFYEKPVTGSFVTNLVKTGVIPFTMCASPCKDIASCTCSDVTKTYGAVSATAPLLNPLGGLIEIVPTEFITGTNNGRRFTITLYGISQKTCFPIVSSNWNSSGETVNVIESIKVNKGTEKGEEKKDFPISLEDVLDTCKTSASGDISIVFTVR